jgi:ferric-dicitrate binding protein FerR (iron transport regulator)
VARLSRYTDRPILLDPALAAGGRRVTGVFFIGDHDHFASGLASALDLAVERAPDGSERLTIR